MAKPVERSGFINVWILIQQNVTGTLQMLTTNSSTLGLGFYLTEREAQQAQTIELLKNNKVNVFLIEWPLNNIGTI
jgi:hypothetical protein